MRTLVKAKGIYAGGTDQKIYRWMELNSDYIKAIGGDDSIPAAEDHEVQVIDLSDYFILPGLIDSHIHVNMLGEQLLIKDQSPLLPNCDLKQCTSVSQIVNLLTETVKQRQRPENSTNMPVLVGTGWHESNLGGETLVRSHMETINFPIVLFRNCYHLCVLNTSALTLFGLLKTASGSSVAHNCQHKLLQELSDYLKNAGANVNRETGHCRETAVFRIRKFIYLHYPEQTRAAMFERGLRECLSNGLTAVQTNDFYGAWPVYRKLANEGRLPIRVYLTVPLEEIHGSTGTMIIQGEVPLPDDSTGLLSCHRVKLFADGSLGAKTAALREPYCRHGSSGGGQGVLIMSQEELVQEFRYADEKGYRLEVHVIGDQAAEVVLDALEEANISPDQRPILTHCQVLAADLIQRMAAQGVIANVQPSFLISDGHWVEADLGKDRMRYAYAWKSLLDASVVVAGGSDAPVEEPNPFLGMHAAIYRTIGVQPDSVVVSPAERLSFAEACRMYTFNGAYTAGEEDRLGMLKPGYKADFVVVDRPVWESSAERTAETWQLLRQVKVHQVWVDGVERYAAK